MNFLENLIAQWYQYKGYYVRQNVKIGKLKAGGYSGEIDIVAFHPKTQHLIHLEVSTDASSWDKRESTFKKKLKNAKAHIPNLFEGFQISEIEQKVVLFSAPKTAKKVAGVEVIPMHKVMQEMYNEFKSKKSKNEIVPENYSLVRAIQVFVWTLNKIEL